VLLALTPPQSATLGVAPSRIGANVLPGSGRSYPPMSPGSPEAAIGSALNLASLAASAVPFA
jgi:hypothetical protein